MKKIKQQSNHLIRMVALLALLLVGINASWAQDVDILNITDLFKNGENEGISNNQGSWVCQNATLYWTAGLLGEDNANVVTVGDKKFVKLERTADKYIKIQFAKGKIKAGDKIQMEVIRCVADQDMGFFTVKQTEENAMVKEYNSQYMPKANYPNMETVYTLNYSIEASDINTVDENTENIILTGWWSSSTAYHSLRIYRSSFTVNYYNTGVVPVPADCDWWYTLGNDETKIKETRTVPAGTKVTYHSSDANSATHIHNGWYKYDVPKSGEGGYFNYNGKTWIATESLAENLIYVPEFQPAHRYVADGTGARGTVIVYENAENKTNISGNKYQSWLMHGATFEATPAAGYKFSKWKETGETANPLTVSEYANETTYTRTAIFIRQDGNVVVNFGTNAPAMGSVKAYVNGEEIVSGADVPAGTKVTFTATPEAGYLIWRWNVAGGESQYPQERTIYERTIDEDCTITGEFQTGIHVRAYTNDANLGTVMIENSGKSATDFHVTTYPGRFTFKATEVGRGVFQGWFSDVDCTQKVSDNLEYTTPESGDDGGIKTTDYNLWAKFESGYQVNANVSPSYLHPTIKIHQYNHEDWGIENHSYVRPNTTAVFNITGIPTGYSFDGWYNGSTRVSEETSYHLEGDVKSDVTLVAKLVMAGSQETSADFTDRGKGGNLNWENGVLTTSGSTDNWANIFVFPPYTAGAETHKNVTETADNFRSFSITAKGDEYRVLVFYGAGSSDNVLVETVPASDENVVTKYYSLNKINLPEGKTVRDIQRIVVAGTAADKTTTFTEAKLYKDVISALDFNSVAGNNGGSHGGNKTWTVEGDKAIMTTSGTSWNQEYIYDFTTGGNMDGHSATEFTGIRVHSTGDRFRVIAYVDDGVDGEGNAKTRNYVGYVTNTGTGTEAKTQHFQWSELKGQWDQIPMTPADVAKIKYIAVAGDNAGSGNTRFELQNVWLDNIKDYEHTFVCYGEEGGKYNWDGQSYSYTQNGSSVAISNILGGDRNGENCIKIKGKDVNATATIKSPSANSFISDVKIIFADGSVVMPEIVGDVSQVVYTNKTGIDKFIAKIEYKVTQSSYSKSKTITSSGENRDYWIYVPASITGSDSGTYPVVFSLHGSSNDYLPTDGGVQNYNDLADQKDFIVVYPRGRMLTLPHFSSEAVRGWEATGENNKDVQFMRDIIHDITTNDNLLETLGNLKNKINTNKIYLTGFSNGGMMAYAVANAAPELFAAYASISGLPMNEFHLQHNGDRPVPFLHIHGTKDAFVKYVHMPNIVDNMIFRNGCNINPTTTIVDNGANVYGTVTRYTKNEYTGGTFPYVYYTIGTGMNTADTGMGHNVECKIGDKSSKEVIWEFMNQYALNASATYTTEFKANITTVRAAEAREHGWLVNDGNLILAQYGESGGYTATDENTYHSIQLKEGTHYLKFNATNSDSEKYVTVRLTKLSDTEGWNKFKTIPAVKGTNGFSAIQDSIIDRNYYCRGDIIIEFTTDETAEYQLTIMKGNRYDNGTVISNVEISTQGQAAGTQKEKEASTDFTGYFNYNNRLAAQWNFDLCDKFRFDASKLNDSYWDADKSNSNYVAAYDDAQGHHPAVEATYGSIVYTYKPAIGGTTPTNYSDYRELTYDGTNVIPVSAGLKFQADANTIKVKVDLANGLVTATHLIVDQHVKVIVPYVENSFRNDIGENAQPDEQKPAGATGDGAYDNYKNCLHHINRDIVYIALNQGSVWDEWVNGHLPSENTAHINEKCIDDNTKDWYNRGGEEYVNGHHYYKCNYMGNHGTPCVIQFKKETVIDRLGVNRNLTYSFYSEYINELGYSVPKPGFRIVGSPTGQKVANFGSSAVTYENAIAMTYGGWQHNGGSYKRYDTSKPAAADAWTELGVYNGKYNGEDVFVTFSNMANAPASDVTAATDGFPVFSRLVEPATSENLMPNETDEAKQNAYHMPHAGLFEKGVDNVPVANVTPWKLPARGGFLKFEPTLPGVLNVHVIQIGGAEYYIADEAGKLITNDKLYWKTAITGNTKTYNSTNCTFSVENTDYVKYSFNVYPGKTYYIFSNTAGIGMTGFYYEPYVYRTSDVDELARENVGMKAVSLDENAEYSLPSGMSANETIESPASDGNVQYTIKYDNKAVKVTLNRGFVANKWNSICLPFSMNKVQMEEQFGKGTKVILLRDIQGRNADGTMSHLFPKSGLTTANFIYHENQDIIAGYPYLILPTKPKFSNKIEANVYIPETAPSIVTIGSAGMNNTNGDSYGGVSGWVFNGTYSNQHVNDGSYVISGGKLCPVENNGNGLTLKSYRAWLDLPTSSPAKGLRLQSISFGGDDDYVRHDDATGIDINEALFNQGIFINKTDIYSINGQLVRKNAENLKNLPKGIYIVNGKKFMVK